MVRKVVIIFIFRRHILIIPISPAESIPEVEE